MPSCFSVGGIVLVINRTSPNKSGNVLQVVGSTLGLVVGHSVLRNSKCQLQILGVVIKNTLSGTRSTGTLGVTSMALAISTDSAEPRLNAELPCVRW